MAERPWKFESSRPHQHAGPALRQTAPLALSLSILTWQFPPMGEFVEASADIELGEAIRPAADAHARIHRDGFGATLILAVPFIGGIMAGSFAGMAVAMSFPQFGSWPTSILSIAGMFFGLLIGLRLYARRHLTGFLAALRKLGSPATFPTRFRFDADAISIENERLSHRIAWPAVLLIVPSKQHWLLQVDTITLAVPFRAFADAAAEQAFVDLAQKRLAHEARQRSVFKKH